MVLILHIRFVHMEYCSLTLMISLPVAWIAVGGLLLVLLLIMSVLLMLKSREVTTLKKQCDDLRDTMRMMRYEEANLARMLHTANKPTSQSEIPVEQVEEKVPVRMTALVSTEPVDDTTNVEEPVAEVIGESSPSEPLVDAKEQEDTPVEDSEEVCPEIEAPLVFEDSEEKTQEAEATIESAEDSPAIVEELQPTMAQPHKQPINERRPAIPTDLFAAWFAENETVQEETLVVASAETTEETIVEESVDVEEVVVREENHTKNQEEVKPSQEIELSKDDERFCRKLERIVNTRLRNPNLNIDIIASQFGIGRTNFYRKVRELTGMSPNDYLRKCRMERAAELLNSSEATISEVCAQVGIPDAQYFSRVFKAYYGVSPSVYKENNNQ